MILIARAMRDADTWSLRPTLGRRSPESHISCRQGPLSPPRATPPKPSRPWQSRRPLRRAVPPEHAQAWRWRRRPWRTAPARRASPWRFPGDAGLLSRQEPLEPGDGLGGSVRLRPAQVRMGVHAAILARSAGTWTGRVVWSGRSTRGRPPRNAGPGPSAGGKGKYGVGRTLIATICGNSAARSLRQGAGDGVIFSCGRANLRRTRRGTAASIGTAPRTPDDLGSLP